MTKVKFDNGAFKVEQNHNNLSTKSQEYTEKVREMNSVVDTLDRYDDFSNLKIKVNQYEFDRDTGYGIIKAVGHNHAIIRHQQKAAQRFLSDFRGFGLLADVVGSGKTFEAGVILSELAYRGRIKNILVVAPKQVYSAWINVLENCFGLGRGQIVELNKNPDFGSLKEERQDIFYPEKSCYIVSMEDFVKWGKENVEAILFDVIVVDEAHHICDSEGQYSGVMELLSFMMQVKNKADKKYCILLSATPHSGNLENMFNLWYFIKEYGCMEENSNIGYAIRNDYQEKKDYYKNHICRGASTIAEYIRIVKRDIIETQNPYKSDFEEYLAENKITNYNEKKERERDVYIENYLNKLERKQRHLYESILTEVATKYHEGIVENIMVRQAGTPLSKDKRIVNLFFYPTNSNATKIQIQNGYTFSVDDFSIVKNGNKLSFKDYQKEIIGREEIATNEYSNALNSFLGQELWIQMGVDDKALHRDNSISYYRSKPIENVENEYFPVRLGELTLNKKLEKLKELLRKHNNERVLIFFDYDKRNARQTIERVKKALELDVDIKNRILYANEKNSKFIEAEFNKDAQSSAILFSEDAKLTESSNLQKSQVIINFEVPINPISMDQRIGRIFRIGQQHDVTIYSLADMTELEGYVLMYYTNIGLLSSNNGDATILAGSSNERMVTIRCKECERVKLLSLEDYNFFKEEDSDEIYCQANEVCIDNENQKTEMTEISTYDFKCSNSNCQAVFTRTIEPAGYSCMANEHIIDKEIMSYSGELGDRKFSCQKICAIYHCNRLKEIDCKIIRNKLEGRNRTPAELQAICGRCKNRKICEARGCVINADISKCHECGDTTCRPKPHTIEFDVDKWEAKCPVCGEGTIKPVQAKTFATFVQGLWDYQADKGASFCDNLTKEMKKVQYIKHILEKGRDKK